MNNMDDDISVDEMEIIVEELLQIIFEEMLLAARYYYNRLNRNRAIADRPPRTYSVISKIPKQIKFKTKVLGQGELTSVQKIRMTPNAFGRLSFLLESVGGLHRSRFSSLDEKVISFRCILGHHYKNCTSKLDVLRSGATVSSHFHQVLQAVLRLHAIFLVKPKPVGDVCDKRWKAFKDCLGALDGTYVDIHVRLSEQCRYRNRKGNVFINVLGVCDQDMNFIYAYGGFEGSAADSRVLREAMSKPNGFKVPQGKYYLVDCGYGNGEGILAPYRGVRYHLKEWENSNAASQNFKEYFNMKHSSARNTFERDFEILKMRWAILRSLSFYDIDTQGDIILACMLLHNFIRKHIDFDPADEEAEIEAELMDNLMGNHDSADFIDVNIPSTQWNAWRDELATSMFNEWKLRRIRRGLNITE